MENVNLNFFLKLAVEVSQTESNVVHQTGNIEGTISKRPPQAIPEANRKAFRTSASLFFGIILPELGQSACC